MRELKFRFWNTIDKGFVKCDGWNGNWTIDEVFLNMKKYNLIPLQYTGIKDKNGKEIYEKDIVKVWVYDEEGKTFESLGIFEVFYNEELCMFSIKNKDGNWSPNSLGVFKQIEVIGNVFENKDLLDK